MTFEARVSAVAAQKFTERQARFLVTVMLHSGVCMIRQYCAFSNMVYGQTARDFFARLIDQRLATVSACAHKRARNVFAAIAILPADLLTLNPALAIILR